MVHVAGLVRKSPGKKEVREKSIDIQKEDIYRRVKRDFDEGVADCIRWFVDDGVSRDNPVRPELELFFKHIDSFTHAYCLNPDRYGAGYVGLMWFVKYFASDWRMMNPHKGCKLVFVDGVANLYNDEDYINPYSYQSLFFLLGSSTAEVVNTRQRSNRGRERLRGTPEWKEKYKGRRKKS